MTKLEPIERPLPCYSVEYNNADPRCQKCPHQQGCIQHSGARANKIPLSKLEWRLIPDGYTEAYDFNIEDPELPHIQRTYFNCYETVFKNPPDDVTRFAKEVIASARQVGCSVRMFFLSNMVGYREANKIRSTKSERAFQNPFHAKLLVGKLAIRRATMYSEMCSKEFGTFTLSSLSTLTEEDYEKNSLESKMLHSEATVGRFIVGHKIFHGGPPWTALFDKHELTLDPHWLAIEKVYIDTVLQPYLNKKSGSDMIQQHRFSVTQVLGHLKKHKTDAINTFYVREKIMKKALGEVLHQFGHQPDDFLIDPEPITEPLTFWVWLSRAIQHFQCLLYLEGKPSLLDRR